MGVHSIFLMTNTTAYLLDPNDTSCIISELHFTSKDAAHEYFTLECPNGSYAFAEDFDRMMEQL